MKTALSLLILLPLLWLAACKKTDTKHTHTETVNLQIDGYTPSSGLAFQGGFISGEGAEVTLGPVSSAYQITTVQLFFGGMGMVPSTRDIVVKIYKDTGANTPGASLYTGTHSLRASDDVLQSIDLRSNNIVAAAGGKVRIAIEMTAAGLPSIAIDKDGTLTANANWIKTGGNWLSAASQSISGDFIIRATVEKK
jgi:hypothetical protein